MSPFVNNQRFRCHANHSGLNRSGYLLSFNSDVQSTIMCVGEKLPYNYCYFTSDWPLKQWSPTCLDRWTIGGRGGSGGKGEGMVAHACLFHKCSCVHTVAHCFSGPVPNGLRPSTRPRTGGSEHLCQCSKL